MFFTNSKNAKNFLSTEFFPEISNFNFFPFFRVKTDPEVGELSFSLLVLMIILPKDFGNNTRIKLGEAESIDNFNSSNDEFSRFYKSRLLKSHMQFREIGPIIKVQGQYFLCFVPQSVGATSVHLRYDVNMTYKMKP